MTRDGCKGGQGRLDASVREDAKLNCMAWLIGVGCLLYWLVWCVVEWIL